MVDKEKIKDAVASIILAIGEEPSREGLVDTPRRVTQMYEEFFSGLNQDPAEGLATGLEKVRAIGAEAARTRGINEPRVLEKFLETQLAATAADLIIQAASHRQESRGTHARADYPESDDEKWRGHLKVVRQADGPNWWFDALSEDDGKAVEIR